MRDLPSVFYRAGRKAVVTEWAHREASWEPCHELRSVGGLLLFRKERLWPSIFYPGTPHRFSHKNDKIFSYFQAICFAVLLLHIENSKTL